MAAEDRPPAEHLSFLARVAGDIRRFGPLALLRAVEARAPQLPRIGRARRPEHSAVDLAQVATLAFPAHSLEAVTVRRGRATIGGYWLGLTGPMGPLPLHLSEFAAYEALYARKQPFGGFLDLLAQRMLQFFYRAWGDAQPAVHADRPADDRFAAYLAALTGATEGVAADAAFPARARLHYAGLFASRRSAAAVADALAHLLRTPISLLEYQPRWRTIEPGDRTRLGTAFNRLGHDAVLGNSVFDVANAFRVVVTARDARDLAAFLPTGNRFAIAAEAIEAFKPGHLDWDLQVEIDAADAHPARLDGRTRLGWTSWLAPDGRPGRRGDVHLRRATRRIALLARKRTVA